MSPDEIKHFLVAYNPETGEVTVKANGVDASLDVVLLSADSLETIKQTHSSYFTGNRKLAELLPG